MKANLQFLLHRLWTVGETKEFSQSATHCTYSVYIFFYFQNGIFITYKKPESKSNRYKISTIVLAVCLTIVLAGILAYFVIRQRKRHASDNIPFISTADETI